MLAREVHDPGIGFVTHHARHGHARSAARARLLHRARRRQGAREHARRRSARADAVPAPPDRVAAAAAPRPRARVLLRRVDRRPGPHRAAPQRHPAPAAPAAPSTPRPRSDDDDSPEIDREIVDAIRARQRFVLSSHARPDGDSIGSQLAMAYALRGARQGGPVVNADPAPPPLMAFPGRAPTSSIAAERRRRLRRGDRHGVRRSEAHRRQRARALLRDQHRSPSGQHAATAQINWFDATRGRLRRDGLRPDRARSACR